MHFAFVASLSVDILSDKFRTAGEIQNTTVISEFFVNELSSILVSLESLYGMY